MVHVVLIAPEIPPNTGNIGRLCMAAGARLHLIEPIGFRLDDRALTRAGLDYWQHLDWRLWSSWEAFIESDVCKGRYFFIENTDAVPTESLWAVKFQKNDCLIFGRESKGIPPRLLKSGIGRVVHIPMFHDHARSLNLSNAVAIGLYEALRQIVCHKAD
ncbi:MAG: tRNA (cytidine(34)-2'-O)-methyltransferase [Methylacidiphilales bacterium]|nr:tRNA (cytidine(34)-2'-O)-methyltransferase [Candidatus Methylacidiphilales bacterium]MDW8349402.1 tRNA (cytidine(34)-2'-O)-methyltransferase [Verrucomicrobiae bacterium]